MHAATRSALLLALVACGGGPAKSTFPPQVILQLRLPGELAPSAVDCLDIVLGTKGGDAPAISLGFGANPLFIRLQTQDLDGDGRRDTRIRFTSGSAPFQLASTEIRLSAAATGSQSGDLSVSATARRANGTLALDDRCLEGSVLADARVETDAAGQAIRFPAAGDAIVPVVFRCAVAGGCAGIDGGARDGGTPSHTTDAGLADGGAADGG